MHPVIGKFLDDRGTHLAAMIAYFALLSFVPLLLLALSLMALVGEASETGYLIEQLRRAFPETSVDTLVQVVEEIRARATTISIVGAVGLAWGALGFFSVLESAFNIVYGLPNRSFVRQKALVAALVIGSVGALFVALFVGSVGVDLLEEAGIAAGLLSYVYALAISTALIFGLLWVAYQRLTNTSVTWREALPGAAFGALLLQLSFQMLPLFLRVTGDLYALQAFGGLVLLLFWLYVMANIIVFGAEINWWVGRGRRRAQEETVAGIA